MTEIVLEEAIDYLKKVTPEDDPWTAADVAPYEHNIMSDHIDHCIAAILNAVVSGDLVLREEVLRDMCSIGNQWSDECWSGWIKEITEKVYGFSEPYYKRKLGYVDDLIRKYGIGK